jgi:hypothetical protein
MIFNSRLSKLEATKAQADAAALEVDMTFSRENDCLRPEELALLAQDLAAASDAAAADEIRGQLTRGFYGASDLRFVGEDEG